MFGQFQFFAFFNLTAQNLTYTFGNFSHKVLVHFSKDFILLDLIKEDRSRAEPIVSAISAKSKACSPLSVWINNF